MLTNAEIKHLSELKGKAGRVGQAKFLIEGKRAVLEALTNKTSIERIIVSLAIDSDKFSEIYSLAEERRVAIEELPAQKFSKLSSTENSQGVIAIASVRSTTIDVILRDVRPKRSALIVLLEKISDPGNLGTILRSAAWFGVDAVLLGEGSVDIYNLKVVRSAMAAIAELNIAQEIKVNETALALKSIGFTIIASSQTSKKNYAEYVFPARSCIILGAEATGIDKKNLDVCDESVIIPRVGEMESLNVGVAGSIIMSEIVRQRSIG